MQNFAWFHSNKLCDIWKILNSKIIGLNWKKLEILELEMCFAILSSNWTVVHYNRHKIQEKFDKHKHGKRTATCPEHKIILRQEKIGKQSAIKLLQHIAISCKYFVPLMWKSFSLMKSTVKILRPHTITMCLGC